MNVPQLAPAPPKRRRPGPVPLLAGLAVAAVVAVVVTFLVGSPLVAPAAAVPPPPTSDAEPYAREFATELEGDVRTPLPTPETFSHGVNIDGCDRNYGVRGECVPFNFPSGVGDSAQDRCAYLLLQRFGPLEVAGEDRQGLAPADGPVADSGNPYACPEELGT
jgi:hypothetical protein